MVQEINTNFLGLVRSLLLIAINDSIIGFFYQRLLTRLCVLCLSFSLCLNVLW